MSLDPQKQRPALRELRVKLSDYFFIRAISFLLPSFRWSIGTQLYDWRCKLYSICRSLLNTDWLAVFSRHWKKIVCWKTWCVKNGRGEQKCWVLKTVMSLDYQRKQHKVPRFTVDSTERALPRRELWSILLASMSDCILQASARLFAVLLASFFQCC